MNPRPRLSRLRQRLVHLHQEIAALLEVFLAAEPLVRGTVYRLRRRCGRPTCRCGRGKLHGVMVLSASHQGRTRLRAIADDRLAALRVLTQRYRRVWQARARLVRIHREMLAAIDQLEAARRQPED